MDIEMAEWVRTQARAGALLDDLWSPMLKHGWTRNIATARAELTALSWEVAATELGVNTAVTHEGTEDHARCAQELRVLLSGETDTLTADQRDLLAKIATISEERCLDPLEVLRDALVSKTTASALAKNPSKQNLYEPTATAFIDEATPDHVNVAQLSAMGTSVRFSAAGELVYGGRKNSTCKSVDLAITVADPATRRATLFLAAHKYARVSGGHQDNQWDDAMTLLANSDRATDRTLSTELAAIAQKVSGLRGPWLWNWETILVLDGDYFANRIAAHDWEGNTRSRAGSGDDWVDTFSDTPVRRAIPVAAAA